MQTDAGHALPLTEEAAYARVEELSAAPLWRHYGNLFSAEPSNRATPQLWHYPQLRELALHFCDTLTLIEAQRRVLMLVNPGLTDPPATVNTLFAGIQIITAGETAQAHRHTANAFRFIIEGSGAATTVNGERVHMNPGDLLLTPGWHWHDHTHFAEGPMIWLDGLDYPLVNALDAGFMELYPQRLQPTTVADDLSSRQFLHGRLTPAWGIEPTPASPIANYPWMETERAFAAIADDAEGSASEGVLLEYTNPWDGGAVLPTIACRIARLAPGFSGRARRHTASTIYHVVSGSGHTEVDGQTLAWSDKDIFCIPGWAPYRHESSREADSFLFSYSDEPTLKKLGFYSQEWF